MARLFVIILMGSLYMGNFNRILWPTMYGRTDLGHTKILWFRLFLTETITLGYLKMKKYRIDLSNSFFFLALLVLIIYVLISAKIILIPLFFSFFLP